MGLKTICAYLGHRAVYAFRATGRIMNLFFATCAALSKATPREVLRQMAKLGQIPCPL